MRFNDQQKKLTPVFSIPIIEVGKSSPLVLVESKPDRVTNLIDSAASYYGKFTIETLDKLSEYWLHRNENPYKEEIDAISKAVNRSGVYMLNMSLEWSCTSGVGPDTINGGNRLIRTLDWPLDGIGAEVVVGRFQGAEGIYDSVTWPGFCGVLTAVAPDRFSAAINQAPMQSWSRVCWLDWVLGRVKMWRENSLPPVHLLRQVFDQCKNYNEAREILCNTPLSMPALFTLSGLEEDESCLIERTEDEVCVHEGKGAVSNHWLRLNRNNIHLSPNSQERLNQMNNVLDISPNNFDWVTPPILNTDTRLSVMANARTGSLEVLGWGKDGKGAVPATKVFSRASKKQTKYLFDS